MTQSSIIRMSKLYAPTLKEIPTDAEIASHQLLLRAGFIRKSASGVYTFLPLGKKVLAKIENIVREEMDAIGAQEVMMPVLQPAELWRESGRWNDYGPELMRLSDRHDHSFCLGPTHEELLTSLVRSELRSYKQLPVCLYQIQVKFRDEIRPRFGLLRSREFIMKDAYSFHDSQSSLQQTYDQMLLAYGRICNRVALDIRPVEADSGQIGGSVTCEFMALADAGEADLVHCSCGYAANAEAGACLPQPSTYAVPSLKKLATPGVHTISELAEFLNTTPSATVKTLVGKNDRGEVSALCIPGDHELNELKAALVMGGFSLLSDTEMEDAGLFKGSLGPVGLPSTISIRADTCLQDASSWVVGANEEGYHFVGAIPGVDFVVNEFSDLCVVAPGDRCPVCARSLEGARGIEVGQVFQLGDKYSQSMGAYYMAEDGSEKAFLMGCYGVGISRTLAAIVEQHNDEFGIIWPASVAPAHLCIIALTVGDDRVEPAAWTLATDLEKLGFEVAFDDRKERAGVKFADADLIGWPFQVIVGARGLAQQQVEIKHRQSGERRDISLAALTDAFKCMQDKLDEEGFEAALYSSLFS